MRLIPALDGYRGIAILCVMLFHAALLPIGWVGVPIFFTLSSFLITTLQYEQRERPAREYFASFWKRRVLRLFPLHFLYAALMAIPLFWFSQRPLLQLFTLGTFTYNFATFFRWESNPLCEHFWSLGVEMQFYLLWPALILALKERSTLQTAGLTAILLGPAARFLGYWLADTLGVSNGTFAFPIFWVDAFGWGAFLALAPCSPAALFRQQRWRLVVPAAASLLSLAALAMKPGVIKGSMVCVAAAVLLYLALYTRLSAVLEWRWLRFLGTISYGLYVWHFAINNALFHYWPCPPLSAAAVLRFLAGILPLTLLVALFSYRFIEQPFLRRKTHPQPASPVPPAFPVKTENR